MLQPFQLKEVSTRYPQEIAELRDFLLKADCVPGTGESLQTVASRLQRDRAFHRDLTSHLWVVIHLRQRDISYADLLGVLAVAAAGVHFAEEAHEDDAHALLRFVMEARQSLDGVARRESAPVVAPVVVPPRVAQAEVFREPEMLPLRARSLPVEASAFEAEDDGGSRKRFGWIAAACVLAALAVGLVLHARSAPDAPDTTIEVATSAAAASGGGAAADVRGEVAPVAAPSAGAKRSERELPHALPERRTDKPSATRSFVPAYSSAPQPVIASAAPSKAAPVATYHAAPTAAPVVRRPGTAASAVSLGGPVNSADADPANSARGAQAPQLLRRKPDVAAPLVAENRPPAAAAAKGPHGTVQAITLGSSASSVLYSPTPAYPAAASAAHVQGEVKLEANVDRQGNVASVRVISGPPMLREAAMDAAQRWRYRPNFAGGEATTMSAVTVFAFQLP